MIRVFPRRNKWTPTDELSFVGDPPLIMPPEQPVRVSCTFTWDREEALRLGRSWSRFYSDVQVGGPAFDDEGGEFEPGRFLKKGVTITSRGCPYSCSWCFVPAREGNIRELKIKPGYIVEDNNLLACSERHITKVFEMLSAQKEPANFNGGLDAKLLNKWHIKLLLSIKVSEMWFSCDTVDAIANIKRISSLLEDFPPAKKRCYVLVGFEGETIQEADKRLREIYNMGFFPFAMLYKSMDAKYSKDRDWMKFLRYWCRPAAYNSKKIKSWMDL